MAPTGNIRHELFLVVRDPLSQRQSLHSQALLAVLEGPADPRGNKEKKQKKLRKKEEMREREKQVSKVKEREKENERKHFFRFLPHAPLSFRHPPPESKE